MKSSSLFNFISLPKQLRYLLAATTTGVAALLLTSTEIKAQVSIPSAANPSLFFQTNAPFVCANTGDWYTTSNPAGCAANSAGQPGGTNTSNPAGNRLHRFFISITQADLNAAGGSISISVLDAESNGATDQVSFAGAVGPSGLFGANTCGAGPNPGCDPTRFTLRAIDLTNPNALGTLLDSQIIGSVGTAAPDGTNITFAVAITQPGTYEVTSETGALPIFGDPTFNLNNDENSFRIQLSASSLDLLIGQFQGAFEKTGGATPDIFFLVGPGTTSLLGRSFDLDGTTGASYISPAGGIGTSNETLTAPNGVWNNGGNLDTGSFPINGLNPIRDAGRWTLRLNGFGNNNQGILEMNNGNNERLVLLDTPPLKAGNFTITPPTPPPPLQTQVGQQVCQPFTVKNNFFTSDIINLNLSGTNVNYTVRLLDANGNPVGDTDGDINNVVGAIPPNTPDTGILQPGQSRTFQLCVTPNPGATTPDTTVITATSFMDRVVRAEAGTGAPVPQPLPVTTTISTITGPNLRLVKRITAVTRNGVRTAFTNFVDDSSDSNDTAPGWAAAGLIPTGLVSIPTTNPLRSGDEVEYTLYFLSDGLSPVLAANLCDQLKPQTVFVANSIEVKVGRGAVNSNGVFFPPLNPLPPGNSCTDQNNPDGSVVFEAGDVPNTPPGQNVGFARLRVRLN